MHRKVLSFLKQRTAVRNTFLRKPSSRRSAAIIWNLRDVSPYLKDSKNAPPPDINVPQQSIKSVAFFIDWSTFLSCIMKNNLFFFAFFCYFCVRTFNFPFVLYNSQGGGHISQHSTHERSEHKHNNTLTASCFCKLLVLEI